MDKVKYNFIVGKSFDPYFNLASEEYLLKQTNGYYIYLWINSPAVILGVNQNAMEEVNISYAEENGIKVVRRLTGGGAVYHDKNNVCYTVISPYAENTDTYRQFSRPVIEYLNSLKVIAEFSGRNDIMVDGKKISGNAETVWKGRIMHHGTLLFNTDMSPLTKVLIQNKLKIESKGIKSIRARVTNIYDCMPEKITTEEFFNGLKDYFLKECELYEFSKDDIDKINTLAKEKYSTYEWNIAYSPKAENRYENRFDFGTFIFCFDLEGGKMKNVRISGDFFEKKQIKEFSVLFEEKRFIKEELKPIFLLAKDYILNADGEKILNAIFG